MAGRRRCIALITRGRLGAPRIATRGLRCSAIQDGIDDGVVLATWDEETGFTSSVCRRRRLERKSLGGDGLAAGVGNVIRTKPTLCQERVAIAVLNKFIGNTEST